MFQSGGAGGAKHSTQHCSKACSGMTRFRELFGGHLGYHTTRGWSQYKWGATGDRARRFLAAVMPYLSPRRVAQAQRALGAAA